MPKSLSQIAFDFSAMEEPAQPVIAAVADRVEETPVEANNMPEEIKVAVKPERKETAVAVSVNKRGRRSLKDNAATAELVQVPEDDILFKKQYYSIGEVAQMFRENQSLIRFWETEFDILQPRKNRKGDRFFRPVDIKNLVLIHDLLRRRKFTIEGAREYLKKNNAQSLPGKAEEKFELIQSLKKVRSFLLEIKASL
jgi:DNA-binding transcriptional MerR regulator